MDTEPPSLLIAVLFTGSTFIIEFIVLLGLLICSALISGAEVAFFSFSQTDINEAESSDTNTPKIAARLLSKPQKLLATILIANNFINIAIVLIFSSLGSFLFASITGKLFGFIDIRFIVEVIAATFLILFFGEILPKIYASRNKKKFAYFMAYPLIVLDKMLSFLSLPMRNITQYLQKNLGKQKSNISVNQLSHALELTSEKDTTQEEQKILQGIVSFGNTDTRQVMRPRIDIFSVSEDMKFQELIQEIIKNGYSRIPVHKDNIDHVTGVLYVKDLLPHIDNPGFNWASLKREPYFVPETKKLDDLLKEFQEKKNHLAIVVDEYGGTSGLVSLEDIIEEIVGDISDEFDDEDIIFSKLDNNNYVFEGKTPLKDFYRILKLEDKSLFETHKGESETIAGFILEIAGVFPKKGEKIIFNHVTFTVEALDRKRIRQIKVTL